MAQTPPTLEQAVVLFLCIVELIVFLYFLADNNAEKKYMISDEIFSSPTYCSALTFFLGCRLAVVVLYSGRFRNCRSDWLIPGLAGPLIAFGGW